VVTAVVTVVTVAQQQEVCLFVCLGLRTRQPRNATRQSGQDDKRPVRGRDSSGPPKCCHGA
jgi:hypothetical protein